ncbi:MAG: DUF1844 domain-containing protein [Candidatus Marinimicrobia bacterium]|nr:DUF1844 domain-containing protein [Candidatus Neomarinimicrobiota bacterium]
MSKEQPTPEEQLFLQLVSSLATGTWIAMGKLANPATGKIERNLQQATYSLDTLDMLAKRMTGNLADWEQSYLSQVLTDLKMNYLDEQKKGETEPVADVADQEPAEETGEEQAGEDPGTNDSEGADTKEETEA